MRTLGTRATATAPSRPRGSRRARDAYEAVWYDRFRDARSLGVPVDPALCRANGLMHAAKAAGRARGLGAAAADD